jgi:chromosome segregation ATPase
MISEFQDLSDKIGRLADLLAAQRRENAALRASNQQLSAENLAYAERLAEVQQRVEAVIEQLPAPEAEEADHAEPVEPEAAR